MLLAGLSSYLIGAAWKMPTWYRTKKPRARKGESFQKPMMPLQGKNHVTIYTSLEFFEPTDLDSGLPSASLAPWP